MSIIKRSISELKINDKNPRKITQGQLDKLKKSISDFPQMLEIRPIVIDVDGVVLGGNMRLRALKELGFTEVPTIVVDELTDEQKKEFIIKDNIGYGEWDWDILEHDWDIPQLKEWGLEPMESKLDESFSQKIGEVHYEPNNTNHKISDLFVRETKYDDEISRITNPELQMLFVSRTIFLSRFYYSRLADYYAYQASDQEKVLFEKLALVLLDKDQLIHYGFSELKDDIDFKDYE
jgi:hypothetical protein